MDGETGSSQEGQSLPTQDMEKNLNEDANIPVDCKLEKTDKEIMTTLEADGQNPKEDEGSHSKERISPKKLSKAPLETAGAESDTESPSPKGETKNPKEDEGSHSKERILPKKLSKAPLETAGAESDTENPSPKGKTKNPKEDEGSHSKERISPKMLSKAPLETAGAESDTESPSPKAETKNPKEDEESHSKERISPKKLSKAPLETAGPESDTESTSPKGETNFTKKRQSKLEREVSEEVRKRKETIKALLVSSEILPEEADNPEEEEEEEPPPEPGRSHFKFLKRRCGKLVNLKTWVAPWQAYNMLETAKSWKPVDEWTPTYQFIRYQNDLLVWRHDHPLAQHIGWDRG